MPLPTKLEQPTNSPPPPPGQGANKLQPTLGQGQRLPITTAPQRVPLPMQPLVPLGPMPGAAPIPGVPPGLEPLGGLTHIFVKQQIELLQVMTGIETHNRYDVIGNGQRMFMAQEITDSCALWCGGPRRPFEVSILDFFGKEVLHLERPCDVILYLTAYPFCCCGKIGGNMFVDLPGGARLGEIVHVFNTCTPKYHIVDAAGQILMTIDGPGCGDCIGAALCGVADFPITSSTGIEIGVIRKTFAGFAQEFMTDADNFGVEFPVDLDIKWKALIFAAVFLIDFMYFEGRGRGRHHHGYGYY